MGDVVDGINAITGGLSLKDIVAGYVDYSKAKLNSGVAMQDNTIDQLKGTVSLLAQQNRALLGAQNASSGSALGVNVGAIMPWLLLGVGAFVVYKMVK